MHELKRFADVDSKQMIAQPTAKQNRTVLRALDSQHTHTNSHMNMPNKIIHVLKPFGIHTQRD